jgi:hypothetical protein
MNTSALVQHARARFDHAVAKKALKEKYEAKMIFSHAGGMWRAGPELLTVLIACPGEEAVILDLYDTPVHIKVEEMQILAEVRWQEQMNAWLIELTESNQKR